MAQHPETGAFGICRISTLSPLSSSWRETWSCLENDVCSCCVTGGSTRYRVLLLSVVESSLIDYASPESCWPVSSPYWVLVIASMSSSFCATSEILTTECSSTPDASKRDLPPSSLSSRTS